MGSRIGRVCAFAGYDAAVQDIDEGMLDEVPKLLWDRMTSNVEKRRTSQEEVDAALDRMGFTTDLEGPASEADFVTEAIVERLGAKREMFGKPDEVAPEHALLATDS